MDRNDIDIRARAADEVRLVTEDGGASASEDQLVLVADIVSDLSSSIADPRKMGLVERAVVNHWPRKEER